MTNPQKLANCQKACKKCDDARPCPRCVKYNIALTCVNSVRKERKKGIKRGPYKRRQKSIEDSKSGSEQPDSSSSSYVLNPAATPTTAAVNPGITAAAVTSGANPADYGYPSNLTQYSQSFDPYQFAAANVYNNKEQHQQQQQQPQQQQPLSSGVYIVNPGYPGYPIVNGEGTDATSTTDNANNGTQSAYFTEILQHINANNAPLVPGVYYPTTESSTPADQDKHQPTTPVPSTSNSSGTTSPSETAKEDDDSKFARLTQLCSAALRENKEAEDAAAAAAAAAAQAVQTAKAEDN